MSDNKTVQEIAHKFYLNIEDAEHDTNRFFVEVEVECGIAVNEKTMPVDVSTFKIINHTERIVDATNIAHGIFKLRTMNRETLFGTIHEKVYVLSHYVDYEEEEDEL